MHMQARDQGWVSFSITLHLTIWARLRCLQVFYLHVCMCIPGVHEGHKRTLDLLELKYGWLQSHHVRAWNQTWVLCNGNNPFLPSILRQVLSLNPELTIWLHWLARKPQEPACLCTSPPLSQCYHTPAFTKHWRSKLRFLRFLPGKVLVTESSLHPNFFLLKIIFVQGVLL